MRTLQLICGLLASVSIIATAQDLPRGVYKLSELDAAVQQATTKKQPLIFIWTDLASSCGLCLGATEDSFKAFRSRGTMVYIDSKGGELSKAPKAVIQLCNQPAMGKIIPMIMVTTADGSKGIKGIPYDELKGGQADKAARSLRRTLEGMDVMGQAAHASEPPSEAKAGTGLLAPEQTWQNAEGKTITAAVKQVDESSVTFVLPGGKVVSYPLDKLSGASREKLSSLAE